MIIITCPQYIVDARSWNSRSWSGIQMVSDITVCSEWFKKKTGATEGKINLII